ncbi:MAG: hypothetical protein ACRYGK_14000 [Janthinobacterium lividum]
MHLPQLINVWSVGHALAIDPQALGSQHWDRSANASSYASTSEAARAHTTPEPAPDTNPVNDPIPTEVPPLDPVPVQDPIPHQEPIRARLRVV